MAAITSAAQLRDMYGQSSPRAAAKVINHLDRHCREFIANSPFLLLATTNGEAMDVSPKGDPAGFVIVEDDHHLIIPDRPGNNRIDGFLNIIACPQVALLFLIPTVDETRTVLRVTVKEVFSHCGKAPLRAGLWKSGTWPAQGPVATLNEIIRDHSGVAVDSIEQSAVDDLYRKTLY